MMSKLAEWLWFSYAFSILLIYQISVSGFKVPSGSCSDGQVLHRVSGTSESGTRCCKPWNFNCPAGYMYTICSEEGDWDSCQKCNHGYLQPHLSNVTNQIPCYKKPWGCASADMINVLSPDRTSSECICDFSQDYFLIPGFGTCFKLPLSSQCAKGKERHKNKTCQSCKPGTFKDWNGSGFCKPVTNCEATGRTYSGDWRPEADNPCEGDIESTSNPLFITTPSIRIPRQPNNTVPDSTLSDPDTDKSHPVWHIILGCIVGVVLAVIVAVIIYKKCFQTRREGPSNRANPEISPYSVTYASEAEQLILVQDTRNGPTESLENGSAAKPRVNGPTAPQTNGSASAQTNGSTAPQTNGSASAQTNGPTAQTNGLASAQTNGPTAQTNGSASAQTNGSASAQTNGPTAQTNGSALAQTNGSTAQTNGLASAQTNGLTDPQTNGPAAQTNGSASSQRNDMAESAEEAHRPVVIVQPTIRQEEIELVPIEGSHYYSRFGAVSPPDDHLRMHNIPLRDFSGGSLTEEAPSISRLDPMQF